MFWIEVDGVDRNQFGRVHVMLLYAVVGGMIVSCKQQVAVPGLVVRDFYLLQTPGNG